MRREAVIGLIGGLVVTSIYVVAAQQIFETATTQLEFWSLVASLACVLLCRTENVLANPIGIIAVVLTGIYFLGIALPGQGWLQLGFYVPVQFVGWWAWCRGGAGGTALNVTRLSLYWWVVVIIGAIATWAACWICFQWLYGPLEWMAWDTSIVAASVTAQLLMTAKKLECWLWWQVPVNLSAIALYTATGAWAFAFLYIVYLVNASSGFLLWRRTLGAA
jgi:nicotinamide mononucleotide transporter